jgi:transposase
MGKSYSSDLRERVIGFVEAGHSRRAAASHFNVSPSFAVKLLSRLRKTASLAPAKQGRPCGGGKLAKHRGFLIARVEKQPDITMPELAAALETAAAVRVSPASLSRFLCKAGFTYKKNASGGGARTRGRQASTNFLDFAPPAPDAARVSSPCLY